MKPDRLQSMIGIAMKAGKLVSGELASELKVKSKDAKLVIIAADASDNTKKLFNNKCNSYGVPVIECLSKEDLGHSIGKDYRAVAAVTDQGIAESIIRIKTGKEECV